MCNITADLKEWFKIHSGTHASKWFRFFFFLDEGLQTVILYRMASWFRKIHLTIIALIILKIISFIYKTEFGINTKIGKGLVISHTVGNMIYANCGKNLWIAGDVTLSSEREKGLMQIGNNIKIGMGARIIRNVKIGNDVKIGANAVVIKNVPNGATVVGVPAKIVKIYGKKVNNKKNKFKRSEKSKFFPKI